MPSWLTPTSASDQPAIREAEPRPTPRKTHRNRHRKPVLRTAGSRTTAWSRMPSVADPASSQIIPEVQPSSGIPAEPSGPGAASG